ncbi:hypothetical protein ACWF76_05260 [Streptomyces globisporus]|uniref:hypothetical protein n=1 Tax=Streptomyces TaxID=1883 RepID=UPI001F0CA369|nr:MULTISPECIES: hypothetical protein [Streptomyces]
MLDFFTDLAAEYVTKELMHIVGQLIRRRDVRNHAGGVLKNFLDPFRTVRQIVCDKDTVTTVDEISGPIPRYEVPDVRPVQLMHT